MIIDWPDHELPEKPQNVIGLLQCVYETLDLLDEYSLDAKQRHPPIVVHCSAGAGRCGVLVLLDAMMHCIDAGCRLNAVELTRILRQQRMGAIETDKQLTFACQAALTYFSMKR